MVDSIDSGRVPQVTLPLHGLTRFLRVRLEVADGVLRWQVPRTILRLVPIGVGRVEVPLTEVRSIDVRIVVSAIQLLVGAACLVVPILLAPWWVSVPTGFVGVFLGLLSFGPEVTVVTDAGERHRAGVCYGHRFDAELYAEAVRDLAERLRSGAQTRSDV